MNLEHHSFYLISRLDDFGGMLHAARPGHLADVDQTLDTRLEFHECSVIGHIDNAPDDPGVHRIPLGHRLPGIWFELFYPQRDALLAAVELQDLYRDLVTNVQQFRWMRHTAVRHIGHVQQSI